MNIVVKRGDIFYADLGVGMGAVARGERPVVIIQNNIGNKFSPTVIVAAITSQINTPEIPTHVEISLHEYELKKDSVILLEQIFTLDKRALKEKIGTVNGDVLEKIEKGLSISLSAELGANPIDNQEYEEYREQMTKPLVYTEGKTDVILIETAWKKLYPDRKMFFEFRSSGIEIEKEKKVGNADKVKKTIEILSTIIKRPIIGLFDNDGEGNKKFKSLNKDIFEEYDISSSLRKHRTENIWGMLLPVPSERESFVASNDIKRRYFVMEHYFSNDVLIKHSMYGKNILGTSAFRINDEKKVFAQQVNELEPVEFENFKILFEKIKETFDKAK